MSSTEQQAPTIELALPGGVVVTIQQSADSDAIFFRRSDDTLTDGNRILAVDAHHPQVPSYAYHLARLCLFPTAAEREQLAEISYLTQKPGDAPWADLNDATRVVYRNDLAAALAALGGLAFHR